MKVACPNCGSRSVRSSHAESWIESLWNAFGFFKLRCRDCDERFTKSIWDVANAIYARCPRCYRLDLSTWDTSHYHAPTLWRVLMSFGARPRRCEACRNNFISFRLVKAKYVRTNRA